MNKASMISVSSMYLAKIWEQQKKDVLDIITIFVKDIIFNSYNIEDVLDPDYISNEMEKNFGYSKFPIYVVEKILNRLCKKKEILRKDKLYILNENFAEQASSFRNALNQIDDGVSKLIKDYCIYIGYNYDNKGKKVEDIILSFFEKYGYTFLSNTKRMQDEIKETEYYNFAKYLLKINDEKPEIFSHVLQLLEGFMIMQIVYFSFCGQIDTKAKLKNLEVYLDSGFLLRALKYKTSVQNKTAQTLIEMLLKFGAELKCFRHTFEEVRNILSYYKNTFNKSRDMTLEMFDEEHFTEFDVDRVIYDLESNLKDLKINVVETQEFNEKNVVYSEENLKTYLHEKMYYSKEDSLNRDIKSITSIIRLREDKGLVNFDKIETSKAIFVTTNFNLCNYIKDYFNDIESSRGSTYNILISDVNLTTILWLKHSKEQGILPKIKLLENAYASIYPSGKILSAVRESIHSSRYTQKDEENYYVDLMEKHFNERETREELMEETQGDISKISQFVEEKYKEFKLASSENKTYKELIDKLKKDNVVQKEIIEKQKNVEESYKKRIQNMEQEKQVLEIKKDKSRSRLISNIALVLVVILYVFLIALIGFLLKLIYGSFEEMQIINTFYFFAISTGLIIISEYITKKMFKLFVIKKLRSYIEILLRKII